jgi:hypothetical protein
MDTGVKCIGKALRETQHDTKIVVLQALSTLLKLKVYQYWYTSDYAFLCLFFCVFICRF